MDDTLIAFDLHFSNVNNVGFILLCAFDPLYVLNAYLCPFPHQRPIIVTAVKGIITVVPMH